MKIKSLWTNASGTSSVTAFTWSMPGLTGTGLRSAPTYLIPMSFATSYPVPEPLNNSANFSTWYFHMRKACIQPEQFPRYLESPHSLFLLGNDITDWSCFCNWLIIKFLSIDFSLLYSNYFYFIINMYFFPAQMKKGKMTLTFTFPLLFILLFFCLFFAIFIPIFNTLDI